MEPKNVTRVSISSSSQQVALSVPIGKRLTPVALSSKSTTKALSVLTLSWENGWRSDFSPTTLVDSNSKESSGSTEKGHGKKRKREACEIARRELFSPSPVPVHFADFLADSVLGFQEPDPSGHEDFHPTLLSPDDKSYEHQYDGLFYGDLTSSEHGFIPFPSGDLYPLSSKRMITYIAPSIREYLLEIPASKKRRVMRAPRHLDDDRDIDGALILNVPRNRPPEIGINITAAAKYHRRLIPAKTVRKYARNPCDFIDLNIIVEDMFRDEKTLQPVVNRLMEEKKQRGTEKIEEHDIIGRALKETLWMFLKINKPSSWEAYRYADLSMDRLNEVWKINQRQLDWLESRAHDKKMYFLPTHFEYDFEVTREGLLMRAGLSEEAAYIRAAQEKVTTYGLVEGTKCYEDPQAAMNVLLEGTPRRRNIHGEVLPSTSKRSNI